MIEITRGTLEEQIIKILQKKLSYNNKGNIRKTSSFKESSLKNT